MWAGFGFAVTMLVSALMMLVSALAVASHASAKSSPPVPSVAFDPSLAAFSPDVGGVRVGFSDRMRPVAMTAPSEVMQPTQSLTRRAVVTSAAAALPALYVQSAMAEQTLVTRQQAYGRYVPRVERGRDYWASGVQKAISSSNWPVLLTATEKKGGVDRIFGPMELWASSFSGKTISEKTIAMNAAVAELKDAVNALNVAAIGTEKGGGFLGFGQKKIDESKRQQLAMAAYQKGTKAINKYINIGNSDLGLQFQQLDTI